MLKGLFVIFFFVSSYTYTTNNPISFFQALNQKSDFTDNDIDSFQALADEFF